MPETATTEFWRDLTPITKVFQPDAMPEVYLENAPIEDDRYYVPFTDTVLSRPLWISPTQNKWCDILMAKKAGLVNRHYHPHEVFAYTISGKWGYLEHDWTATAGDFVYETPGEGHTLVAYESVEPMQGFLSGDRSADLARRSRRARRFLRRPYLYRALSCPLRQGRPRRRLRGKAVPLKIAQMLMPPSTISVVPVTKLLSSLAR
jgi:2,4'-dihydroxyacetophenone dioxygenase